MVLWPWLGIRIGEAGFSFPRGGGGGLIEPFGWTTPPKKGSIDRTPKILQRVLKNIFGAFCARLS